MSLIDVLNGVNETDNDLFIVDLEGTEVIFRLPSFKQASQYSQVLNTIGENYSLQCIVYEHIFQEFVIDEHLSIHNEEIHAGIPETIAKVILYLSGSDNSFQDYTTHLLDIYRSTTNSMISNMQRAVCSVFGGYKISDLEELNFQQLVKIYVEAEKFMLDSGIIQEGLKFEEAEPEKSVSIENTIRQDSRDYRRFDHDGNKGQHRITDNPAYKAKMEEMAARRKMIKGG